MSTTNRNTVTYRKHKFDVDQKVISQLTNLQNTKNSASLHSIPDCTALKQLNQIYNTLFNANNNLDNELNKIITAQDADSLYQNVCRNKVPAERIDWAHDDDFNLKDFCKTYIPGQDFTVK